MSTILTVLAIPFLSDLSHDHYRRRANAERILSFLSVASSAPVERLTLSDDPEARMRSKRVLARAGALRRLVWGSPGKAVLLGPSWCTEAEAGRYLALPGWWDWVVAEADRLQVCPAYGASLPGSQVREAERVMAYVNCCRAAARGDWSLWYDVPWKQCVRPDARPLRYTEGSAAVEPPRPW